MPALCRRASWAGLGRSFPLAKPPAVPFAVLTFALGLPMFARSVPLRLGLRLGAPLRGALGGVSQHPPPLAKPP